MKHNETREIKACGACMVSRLPGMPQPMTCTPWVLRDPKSCPCAHVDCVVAKGQVKTCLVTALVPTGVQTSFSVEWHPTLGGRVELLPN